MRLTGSGGLGLQAWDSGLVSPSVVLISPARVSAASRGSTALNQWAGRLVAAGASMVGVASSPRAEGARAERENSFGNVHMQAPLIRPHSEPSPFARCQNAFERCILERSEASCSYNHLVRSPVRPLCVVRLVYLGDPVPKTKRPCRVRASSMEARFQCRVLFHPASMRSHALSASGLSHGARSRQRCR